MKKLSILGSTGSIGINTLDVVSHCPNRFDVVGLAAGTNLNLLSKQIRLFNPKIVSVLNSRIAGELNKRLPKNGKPEIVYGRDGLTVMASLKDVDLVVSAIVGSDGLIPTYTAIRNGKHVALANKESLVMAGKIVMNEARKHKVKIIPVDSEHSAIFQSLRGNNRKYLRSVVLTASGGPFFNYSSKRLASVTPEEALRHPNWKMGKKVTVDSASMMNKGLEVIEAKWLFDLPLDKIKVYVHPQSVVHAMVEYIDGSVIAQLSNPDMRGPISYALSLPERIHTHLSSLNLLAIGQLGFFPPDNKKFPALGLAYQALEDGETMPAVLNAANEVAVGAFLNRAIRFTDIARITEKTMNLHHPKSIGSLDDVLDADRWARQKAAEITSHIHG